MKTTFLLCIPFLLFTYVPSAAQQGDPELKQEIHLKDLNLKGKVKSLNQTQYAASGTVSTTEARYILGEFGYEPSIQYDDKGWSILFDENGKILEKTNYWGQKIIYQYDNNFITKIDIRSHTASSLGYYLYKYDNGNPVEKTSYDATNKLCGKVQYIYDATGNLIELISHLYDNKGAVREKSAIHYKYEYDNQGNMTEKSSYNTKGYIRFKTSRKYDENGNAVKYQRDYYSKTGRFSDHNFEYNHTYDAQKKITVTTGFFACTNPHLGEYMSLYAPSNLNPYSYDYKIYFTNNYEYDEQGNVILIESTGSRKDLSEYKYEYDSTGNWTRKQYWFNGVLQYTVTRKIEYYQ